ncbi:hypothetical protein [Brevundimonas sp.]|uniref:hypothetical protein n=1 Tax=Brevundimonas sp. TaxID=1871086 RepID=UPI001A32920E|nr:hypothetical protein [Brevundimonas sp.]MBJ7485264.1 hypothetical protein [Brevundimonas sp.]
MFGRFRRPVILLARDLCTFALFDASAVPRSRRHQAARLHARSASPYIVAGVALTRAGDAYCIWWWDLARVQTLLNAAGYTSAPLLRPETMAQPAGRDWRIVNLCEGYEGQLWRNAALVASVWRPTRFDDASWAAFARVQRGAIEAPQTPPQAETLPIADDSEAFSLSPGDISRGDALRLGGGFLASLIASLSLFWAGQGIGLQRSADKIEKEATEIQATTPRTSALREAEAELQRLKAFRDAEAQTSPLSAAGAAIGVLALYDLAPMAMTVDGTTLSATLPYSAVDKASELTMEFEQSGYFTDVRPRTDQGAHTIIFDMTMVQSAPPLTAGE